MDLPPDITGLIFSYSLIRKLAQWINPNDIFYEPSDRYSNSDKLTILRNPAAVDWILDTQNIYEFFTRLGALENNWYESYNTELLLDIFNNTSDKTEDLYDKFNSFLIYGSDPIFDYLNKIDNPVGVQCFSSEFAYNYAKKYYPNNLVDKLDNVDLRCNLLNIKSKIIPELINWYKTYEPSDNILELSALASNPYTWDIFYNYVTTKKLNMSKYKEFIGANTSEKALNYIRGNIQEFIHCSSLYSNPNAFDIIQKVFPIFKSEYNFTNYELLIEHMASNPNPDVIKLLHSSLDIPLSQYINKLSANSSDESVDILLANPNLIDHSEILSNTNPRIYKLLKANYKETSMGRIMANPLIFPKKKFTPKLLNKIKQFYNLIVDQAIIKNKEYIIGLKNTIELTEELILNMAESKI